jgi:hypothetical protein
VRVVLEVGVDAVPAVREVDLPRVNMYHAVRRIKRGESTQIEGTYLRSEILAIVGRDGGELRVCNCSVRYYRLVQHRLCREQKSDGSITCTVLVQ